MKKKTYEKPYVEFFEALQEEMMVAASLQVGGNPTGDATGYAHGGGDDFTYLPEEAPHFSIWDDPNSLFADKESDW